MDFRMRDMGEEKASLYRANIGLFLMRIFHSQAFPSTRTPSSHKKKADALTFGGKAIYWKESDFFFLLAFPSSFHQKRRYFGILYLLRKHNESQIFSLLLSIDHVGRMWPFARRILTVLPQKYGILKRNSLSLPWKRPSSSSKWSRGGLRTYRSERGQARGVGV